MAASQDGVDGNPDGDSIRPADHNVQVISYGLWEMSRGREGSSEWEGVLMQPLVAFNLWKWIEQNRIAFEPPVGNKVIWEDSQFTAMVIRGPNARRDFHVDPSDELFYMLRGDMVLEYMQDGRRQEQIIREGEMFLVPALTPHSPHRPAGTWGLVVEIKRRPEQTESLLWFCDRCDARLHTVTMHVAHIETELKAEIERFDASLELRTCRTCGHLQPESAPVPQAP
jgi:3-hydroxyanthranilate 3,4-dioxygenase